MDVSVTAPVHGAAVPAGAPEPTARVAGER